ncbi:unnamed protein product [Cylicocyclus nassatus]|uniref:Uncharacterized protein n=1 Tax=Cylicocyclus nassatus TaxID=53992 RepID=A0AA36H908_CYLNA|nr:unnamed protein product [Cylicocyclus nassatus]
MNFSTVCLLLALLVVYINATAVGETVPKERRELNRVKRQWGWGNWGWSGYGYTYGWRPWGGFYGGWVYPGFYGWGRH